MHLSVTGNTSFTNALWVYRAGALDTAVNFTSSFCVYLGANSAYAGSFEYDMFDFSSSTNTEFMWGVQWNQTSSVWQVFNQAAGHWVNTSVTTPLAYSTWNCLSFANHRVAGDTNSCSGHPCMYYDSITINGAKTSWALAEPAGTLPSGWNSAVGFQFQIDIGSISGAETVDEYVDLANFTASTSGAGSGGAFANGSGTGYQDAQKIATPGNPASGFDRLYFTTSDLLGCLTSTGGNCLNIPATPGGSICQFQVFGSGHQPFRQRMDMRRNTVL